MKPWMQVTAWTLIHFVWQGGLLALATAAGLRLFRRRSPDARYVIACAGLTAMLALPVATAGYFWASGSALAAGESLSPGNRRIREHRGAQANPRQTTQHRLQPANQW